MFTDYQESVLSTYEKLRDESKLSPGLAHPTTANLRDECVKRLDEGLSAEDEVIVKSFFSLVDDRDTYRASIIIKDPDIFRPLVRLMKRRLLKTDINNVELLAWLIDFKPRPSIVFYKRPVREIQPLVSTPESASGPNSPVNSKVPRKAIFLLAIVGIVLLLTWSGALLWWRNGYIINSLIYPADAKCMQWAGNRYEPVDCNKKSGDAEIIPLDQRKLSRFRRIMLRDTLTRDALGKVWVVNVKGGAEFFTDSGSYPLDSAKKLRPVTTYMLAKYPSYPRYLLNMFIWIVSGLSFGILYGVWAYSYMRKSRKTQTRI